MKNLTLHYSITQFTFWAASTGAASFATTYLLNQGIAPGIVGTLLAISGISSCLLQPIFAEIADHSKHFLLKKLLISLSVLCIISFGMQFIPDLPLPFTGLLYAIGLLSSDSMQPLINALYVSYQQAEYSINYGMARGMGSAASAISSLIIGYIFAKIGSFSMLGLLILFRFLSVLILAAYPKLQKQNCLQNSEKQNCSIWYFFSNYRWYCISLIGILFLGMYHAMTENYLIAILGRLGGNSSHVGKALFLSSISGALVIVQFQRIQKHISTTKLLKISACSFLLKAICFYFAKSISVIYLLELLQMTSYAFLAPAQVYYAQEKVLPADMVKGQAFSTAAYSLGCSAGNFIGGQLLNISVNAILFSGILMALTGTIILFATVEKQDTISKACQ